MHVYLYFVFNFHVFTFSCAGPSLLHTGYSPVAGCGLLTVVASLVVERRLSSCGVWAELPLGHAGSSWTRDQTHAPALVGRFLTIGPTGTSYMYYLFIFYVLYLHKIRTFLCILIIIWFFFSEHILNIFLHYYVRCMLYNYATSPLFWDAYIVSKFYLITNNRVMNLSMFSSARRNSSLRRRGLMTISNKPRFKPNKRAYSCPWRRKWQPLQYSCLENSMDRGTWWATVHGVAESAMTEHISSTF